MAVLQRLEQTGLADAGRADEDDVLGLRDEVELGEAADLLLRDPSATMPRIGRCPRDTAWTGRWSWRGRQDVECLRGRARPSPTMTAPYIVPSSRSDDWRAALHSTRDWAARCDPGHPLLYWREQTELVRTGTASPKDMTELVERYLVPATYLCRVSHSAVHFGAVGVEIGTELQQALRDPGSFIPFEHVLYLASRLGHAGHGAEFVGQQVRKAPDLRVPGDRLVIEARARGPGAPRAPLRSDFEHAEAKFAEELARSDRQGWVGMLAVDLGVCGTPSLPDVARLGPDLVELGREIMDELAHAKLVTGVLVTWVGPVKAATDRGASVGMSGCSGWRMREGVPVPASIADAFDSFEKWSGKVARRSAADKKDPRRG